MDIRLQMLKAERKLNAEQSKILRKYEKHCQRHNALQRGYSNSLKRTQWDSRREDAHALRKAIGKDARYMQLARGFVLDKDYRQIENTTRPTNEPKIQEIYTKLIEFGFDVNPVDITFWLEG